MKLSLCLEEEELEKTTPLISLPPENAVKGLEGMRIADRFLKKRGIAGILIGSLAKEIWRGSLNVGELAVFKDVDVLIPDQINACRPEKGEAGVDWWVAHDRERPNNGFAAHGLAWGILVKKAVDPGLYLCPRDILMLSYFFESRYQRIDFQPPTGLKSKPSSLAVGFSVMPAEVIKFFFGDV